LSMAIGYESEPAFILPVKSKNYTTTGKSQRKDHEGHQSLLHLWHRGVRSLIFSAPTPLLCFKT